jgi:hypothetical protein
VAKSRTPRKKKVVEIEPQVIAPPSVKPPPAPPPPLTEEEEELLAIREEAHRKVVQMEIDYNRDVLPGRIKKLKEAFKKLPRKATIEQMIKAALDALSEGNSDAASW